MATPFDRGWPHLTNTTIEENSDISTHRVLDRPMNHDTTVNNPDYNNSSSGIQVTTTKETNTRLSYSSVTQSNPSKEQAIVIESHDGINIKDYVLAVGKLTSPSNIRYISRISNGRICIFLSSKKVVEELILANPKVLINNVSLEIRPLLTKNKRVILSNVCPVIPNYVIEEELLKIGVKIMSKITPIRAGLSIPGFSHILSFRRQMYIKNEDFDKLPTSLQIEYDGTNYWIYLSTDSPTCFVCKTEGHLAKDCPSNISTPHEKLASHDDIYEIDKHNRSNLPKLQEKSQTTEIHTENEPSTSDLHIKNSQEVNSPTNLNLTPNQDRKGISSSEIPREGTVSSNGKTSTTPATVHLPGFKRPISLASSERTDQNISDNIPKLDFPKINENRKIIHTSKKPKTETQKPTISDMLLPVKQVLETDPSLIPLSYIQLQSFFENTLGVKDVLAIAFNYTDDIEGLANALQKLYPYYTDKSIKNRSSRIVKKLLKFVNQSEDTMDNVTPDYSSDDNTFPL